MKTLTKNHDTPSLSAIQQALPGLSATELTALASRIKALLDSRATTHDDVPIHAEIYAAVRAYLLGHHQSCVPWAVYLKKGWAKQLQEQVGILDPFLQQVSLLRRAERANIFQLGVRLIAERMAERHIPVTARTLIPHLYLMPAYIEQSFPGYLHAGLLAWIVKAHP